ncbi:MAG: DUF4198 domain-containing protein [Flavobacterium psychrophilum]|nr:MAG: DUF4198 domain-containing protein [Flavobacterium psychrophilum]
MKKSILLILLLFVTANSFAHFMWVETSPVGKINKKQEVRVYFGEYTYGEIENADEEAFNKVKNFDVWVISPTGEKTKLQMTPAVTFYSGSFEPKANGTYTVVLNNSNIDVIDYTQYNFGIFKTHYHATAKVEVGGTASETAAINPNGLTIVDISKKVPANKGEVAFKVLYKGQPVKEQEVAVYITDQWSKKLYTDKDGIIKFSLPWGVKYIMETTKKEEVPGNFNGKDYQFIWHCATYSIPAEK